MKNLLKVVTTFCGIFFPLGLVIFLLKDSFFVYQQYFNTVWFGICFLGLSFATLKAFFTFVSWLIKPKWDYPIPEKDYSFMLTWVLFSYFCFIVTALFVVFGISQFIFGILAVIFAVHYWNFFGSTNRYFAVYGCLGRQPNFFDKNLEMGGY